VVEAGDGLEGVEKARAESPDLIIADSLFLCSAVSERISDRYPENIGRVCKKTMTIEKPFETLTPRQREILQLIAEGLTTKEIASRLALSIKTVETHRSQIMDRLNIRDIAGLVRYAIRSGIVRSEG